MRQRHEIKLINDVVVYTTAVASKLHAHNIIILYIQYAIDFHRRRQLLACDRQRYYTKLIIEGLFDEKYITR